jgi:hypothetical protein
MSEIGVIAYDLAGEFCAECGVHVSMRMFGPLRGCKTCEEVMTRHRCTKRPPVGDKPVGETWDCSDCGTVWIVTEERDTCGACGRSGMEKFWTLYVRGDRIDTAPRHEVPTYTPFRDILFAGKKGTPRDPCRRTASGIMIHVKPYCRCPK